MNRVRKQSMCCTCFWESGSCTTGSRVMNFLSLTMLRTSYRTHISVKELLKLFLTESHGQREGWNFTKPKERKQRQNTVMTTVFWNEWKRTILSHRTQSRPRTERWLVWSCIPSIISFLKKCHEHGIVLINKVWLITKSFLASKQKFPPRQLTTWEAYQSCETQLLVTN